MICLTADVHNMSDRSRDQHHLGLTEVELCAHYVEIASAYNLSITLFVSGRAVEEEVEKLKALLSRFRKMEIAGHNYDPFDASCQWRALNKIFGWSHGPPPRQRKLIGRTVDLIEKNLGARLVSWRDHAYHYDSHTFRLLSTCGITHVSDDVIEVVGYPQSRSGLTSVPINVKPDHEYICHTYYRSQGGVSRAQLAPEWLMVAKEQIRKIQASNRVAVVLAHPICMYQADRFQTFEYLCKFIAMYETCTVSAIIG